MNLKSLKEDMTIPELMQKMMTCYQFKDQSILDHGNSVKDYLEDLLNFIEFRSPLKKTWKLPSWMIESNFDLFKSVLPSRSTLSLATLFHDCGKPFCEEIDSEGNHHFPNHAKISKQVFDMFFDDEIASFLIEHDMDIHVLKAEGVESFSKNPHCLTLLLIGLAEIHSNAEMFGGFESVSFKIKWKSLESRGKKLLSMFSKKCL